MKNRKTLAFLWEIARGMRWILAVLVGIQVALSAVSVLYALLLRRIIDAAVAGDRRLFWIQTAVFATFICLQLFLRMLQRHLNEYCRTGIENHCKAKLFHTLLYGAYAQVTGMHTGEWMNRLTGDTSVVANGMTEILPGFLGMAVKLAGAAVVLLVLTPQFVLLALPVGLLMLLFSTAFRRRMKALHKEIREKDGSLRIFLQETLESLLVVRSYAAEEKLEQDGMGHMAVHRQAQMRRNRFSNLCSLGFAAAMNGAYGLGVAFCGYGILTGTMSYGTFTAVLQLIGQIQSPFANISGYFPRYYAMLASAERLMVEWKPTELETRKGLPAVLDAYRSDFVAIGLRDASFTYSPPAGAEGSVDEKKTVVLSRLTLSVRKGQYVAFTGPSGCGKSTVLKLFMCLYPLQGGERLLEMGDQVLPLTESWQRLFAYVPQGNHLMSGSIRDVVTFAAPGGDEKQLQRALSVACADFVWRLPQGADTLLGERGMGLSEGQMQRIAIARAVYSDCPILLLDECTSALDEETEKALLSNLRRMTDKTVCIVTHRPAALEICDTVIRFQDGGCVVLPSGK